MNRPFCGDHRCNKTKKVEQCRDNRLNMLCNCDSETERHTGSQQHMMRPLHTMLRDEKHQRTTKIQQKPNKPGLAATTETHGKKRIRSTVPQNPHQNNPNRANQKMSKHRAILPVHRRHKCNWLCLSRRTGLQK